MGVEISNVKDQLFCCGSDPFKWSDGTCSTGTGGSNAPFPVGKGRVIFDRTSGSTSPNDTTATSTSTVTLAGATLHSVTTSAATAVETAASPPGTVDGKVIVAVAVGVPFGNGAFRIASHAVETEERSEAAEGRNEELGGEVYCSPEIEVGIENGDAGE